MDYHPDVFSIGIRDVAAAWLVCLIAAAALLAPLAAMESPTVETYVRSRTPPSRGQLQICVAGRPLPRLRHG